MLRTLKVINTHLISGMNNLLIKILKVAKQERALVDNFFQLI